jgi:hypothetical protein
MYTCCYTTAVTKKWLCKQRPLLGNIWVAITSKPQQTRTQQLHRNRETVFSVQFVPRCYKQNKLVIGVSQWVNQSARGLLRFSCCEPLLLEASSCGTETVRRPRRRGTSTVGSRYQATAVKTWLWTLVCVCVAVIVKCKVYSRAVSKSPINHVINPKPVYSHSITW